MTSKLFTAEATLKTSEANKQALTVSFNAEDVTLYVNCSVVAVTPEKNAAIVVMLKYVVITFCWAVRIMGIPMT